MTIKKRQFPTNIEIENLANQLADKPYGNAAADKISRITISLPQSVLIKLEDLALSNKRNQKDNRSVSGLIRYCIQKGLNI